MKYYRYIISPIINFIILIETIKIIEETNDIHFNIIVSLILSFYILLIFVNIYKFIRIRFILNAENFIKWSFDNKEWRKYVKNEIKERFKYITHGLKLFFMFYLFSLFLVILPSIKINMLLIIHILIIGLLIPMLIILYNFIKIIFFYLININSNGEIIITKKIILINGEFNDPDTFIIMGGKSTEIQRQYFVYYDDYVQFNILKIESGEIDKIHYKGNKLKVRKIIRIPIKDNDIMSAIKKTFKIKIKYLKN